MPLKTRFLVVTLKVLSLGSVVRVAQKINFGPAEAGRYRWLT
jgi:hypothetical protein